MAVESNLRRLKDQQVMLKSTYVNLLQKDAKQPMDSKPNPSDVWRFLSEQEKNKLMEIVKERHKEETLLKEDPELELVPAVGMKSEPSK